MSSWKDDQVKPLSRGVLPNTVMSLEIFRGGLSVGDCLCGFGRDKDGWREGCKITLFWDLGRLKIAVQDPQQNRVGFATLDTARPLIEALEDVLSSGSIDWRPSKPRPGYPK